MTLSAISLADETWALIPARASSKSIADKNLQIVQGHSLLAWSVLAGMGTSDVSETFVSTDSSLYADTARKYGSTIPFLRPEFLAGDESTDADVFTHFLDWALRERKQLPMRILHLRPTTPTREPDRLSEAIKMAEEVYPRASAVRSVHVAPESPFKWFLTDSDGWLTTMDGQRALDGANRPRSQYPAVYVPNGYVDVVYPEYFLDTGDLHGDSVLPFLTEQVEEVDDSHALDLLRALGGVPESLRSLA